MHTRGGLVNRAVPLRHAVIAGWTGRDPVAREKHIAELEALGVARPATTPIYYRVAAARMTVASQIEVVGEDSSGEAEFVLLRDETGVWVGLGSDHTDRKVEAYNVTVSKQMCDKPLAPELWDFNDVRDHWDALVLRSWIEEDGERRLYQEGTVAAMLPPDTIVSGYAEGGLAEGGLAEGGLAEGTVMLCGTLAAKGGVRPSRRFAMELFDPVRGRKLTHDYEIMTLPVAG
jgi:hypothetical protein